MKSLLVHNHTDSVMTLMLEPIGVYFEIPPKDKVTIIGTFSSDAMDFGEVELHTDCFSVWTSLDAVVMCNGVELQPCR